MATKSEGRITMQHAAIAHGAAGGHAFPTGSRARLPPTRLTYCCAIAATSGSPAQADGMQTQASQAHPGMSGGDAAAPGCLHGGWHATNLLRYLQPAPFASHARRPASHWGWGL